MAVDPWHMYSNEAIEDNYGDYKLEKHLWCPWFMETYLKGHALV